MTVVVGSHEVGAGLIQEDPDLDPDLEVDDLAQDLAASDQDQSQVVVSRDLHLRENLVVGHEQDLEETARRKVADNKKKKTLLIS